MALEGQTKISPAFEPFLAGSGANDKREAIVLYRPPESDGPRLRGRLRTLKKRLDFVKARAAAQAPVAERMMDGYQKAGAKRLSGKQQLDGSAIGAGTLPVASVEITRKTLPALAEQNDVVAVLPNQQVRLIEPKVVDYQALRKAEIQDRITWGLKQLGIRESRTSVVPSKKRPNALSATASDLTTDGDMVSYSLGRRWEH